jgi:hypothetical protein
MGIELKFTDTYLGYVIVFLELANEVRKKIIP